MTGFNSEHEEDEYLINLAEERLAHADSQTVALDSVLSRYGITYKDLDRCDDPIIE